MTSSSDSDEQNTFRYGTPLEPYDDDEVPAKRHAEQQNNQYAVDVHGRRRFHGAFTGGFSAGYGNSVDTPEGWIPGTFKSSRTERAAFKQTLPEDYMDEEDREEFGIAPRQIHTQQDFAGKKRAHKSHTFHDGPIPGEPVLEQFVRAVHETAALRILRGMGWRPGRSVGEYLKKKKKYGCYVPPEFRQNKEDSSDADSELEDVDYNTLFADEPELAGNKTERFGLGYVPLSRHSVLGNMAGGYGGEGSVSHLKMRDKGKKVSIRGQAFGVGALENEDEDVYSTTDMSHYDFAIGGHSAQKMPEKAKVKSEGLEGFVRASKPPPTPRVFPPPALPRDYKPAPAGFRMTRFEKPAEVEKKGRHELSSEDRGAFLGEPSVQTPLSIKPPDKPDAADLIAKITGRNVNFVGTNDSSESNVVSAQQRSEDGVANFNNSSRDMEQEYSSESGVFMPFASNPEKQARYELFLKGENIELDADDRIREWETAREKMEFEQAKKLYRPLTGLLKDRFTTGSGASEQLQSTALSDQLSAARSGMYGHLTRTRAEWRPDSLVCKRFNVPDPYEQRPDKQSAKQKTASYSIFEYLEGSIHSKDSFTKEQSQFSGSKSVQLGNMSKSVESTIPVTLNIPHVNDVLKSVAPVGKIHGNKRITVAELFLMEAEKDRLAEAETSAREITRTIDKFDKMELYNSIFMSDSEEEDEEGKKDVNVSKAQEPVNEERNNSPPRGIFANLDFDKLNARPSKKIEDNKDENCDNEFHKKVTFKDENRTHRYSEKSEKITKDIRDRDIEELLISDDECNVYGPKIPQDLQKRIEEKASEHNPNIIYGNTSVSLTVYKETDIDEVFNDKTSKALPKDCDVYGPKMPKNLRRYTQDKSSERNPTFTYSNMSVSRTAYKEIDIEEVLSSKNFKPLYRDKKKREGVDTIELTSSSSSDAWVDKTKTKKNKKEKKNKKVKKHKHKSKEKKKSKHR